MTSTQKQMISDTTYDVISRFVKYVFPALGTAYFSLSQIWPVLPYGEEVVGSLAIITTLLGVILAAAKKNYQDNPDGYLMVHDGAVSEDPYSLQFSTSLAELTDKNEIRLKVEGPR